MLTELNPKKFQELLKRYQDALIVLRNLGIKINTNSRLIQYVDKVKFLADGRIPNNRRELVDYSFIVMEVDEVVEIVESIKLPIDAEYRERLNDIQKGVLIRTQNLIRARSSQFELYLKAIIELSGISCSLGNPDILAEIKSDILEIEAKRPNQNGLESNLRKGLNQLNKNNSGIIAFSLDHLLLGNNKIIELEKDETFKDGLIFLENTVTEWLETNKKKLQKILNEKKSACSILFLIKVPIIGQTAHEMSFGHHLRLVQLNSLSTKSCMEKTNELNNAIDKIWGK